MSSKHFGRFVTLSVVVLACSFSMVVASSAETLVEVVSDQTRLPARLEAAPVETMLGSDPCPDVPIRDILLAAKDPACVRDCGETLKHCVSPSALAAERVGCERQKCLGLPLSERAKCVARCHADSSYEEICLANHKYCINSCPE